MEEITPPYYAAGERTVSYTVRGSGFLAIPSDAIGVYSIDNDAPLQRRYTDVQDFMFAVEVMDDNTMTLNCMTPGKHSADNYLGAIVSADRQMVVWENTTRPLP